MSAGRKESLNPSVTVPVYCPQAYPQARGEP